MASSAALPGAMAFCGGGCEAYAGRQVASSTRGSNRLLVLCYLPLLAQAGDSFPSKSARSLRFSSSAARLLPNGYTFRNIYCSNDQVN